MTNTAKKRSTSVSPAPPSAAPPPAQAIPLEQIVIEWERPGHWFHRDRAPRVAITGRHLAAVLGWLSRTGHPTPEPVKLLEGFGDLNTIALHLESLGELLEAVSTAENIGEYAGGATYVLSAIIRDYANRLKAGDKYECDRFLKSATVTIGESA